MNIDELLDRLGHTKEEGFERLAPQAIAAATIEVLKRQKSASLADIIAELEAMLGDSPTPEQPLTITIRAAIRFLTDLQET